MNFSSSLLWYSITRCEKDNVWPVLLVVISFWQAGFSFCLVGIFVPSLAMDFTEYTQHMPEF
jgi:hypothetical protein